MGFIVGLGGEKEKVGLKDRLACVVTSDFTDWTDAPITDNIDTEYMCSTVGKED